MCVRVSSVVAYQALSILPVSTILLLRIPVLWKLPLSPPQCPELQDRNLNVEWREIPWSQQKWHLGGKLWCSCLSKSQLFSYSFGSVNYSQHPFYEPFSPA